MGDHAGGRRAPNVKHERFDERGAAPIESENGAETTKELRTTENNQKQLDEQQPTTVSYTKKTAGSTSRNQLHLGNCLGLLRVLVCRVCWLWLSVTLGLSAEIWSKTLVGLQQAVDDLMNLGSSESRISADRALERRGRLRAFIRWCPHGEPVVRVKESTYYS